MRWRVVLTRTRLIFLLQTAFCLTVWFTASIFIAFSSKHLLSGVKFKFPFFLAFCSNSSCAILSFLVTRIPALRQERLPLRGRDDRALVVVEDVLAGVGVELGRLGLWRAAAGRSK